MVRVLEAEGPSTRPGLYLIYWPRRHGLRGIQRARRSRAAAGRKGLQAASPCVLGLSRSESSDWPTVPQVYVKGEFVGGCDIVREMAESGELQQIFEAKGVAQA